MIPLSFVALYYSWLYLFVSNDTEVSRQSLDASTKCKFSHLWHPNMCFMVTYVSVFKKILKFPSYFYFKTVEKNPWYWFMLNVHVRDNHCSLVVVTNWFHFRWTPIRSLTGFIWFYFMILPEEYRFLVLVIHFNTNRFRTCKFKNMTDLSSRTLRHVVR